jgi:nicotinamide mononucleotide transporter
MLSQKINGHVSGNPHHPRTMSVSSFVTACHRPELNKKVRTDIFCIFLILYYILHHFTDSPIPVGDAFTTAVGIVATWMLAKQIIEHWFFWIIVNAVSIYLYYIRGLYPTMFLYICYGVLAIVGLYTWKKKGFKTDDTTL